MRFHRLIFPLLFLFFAFRSFGQEVINIKAGVDSTRILIGQPMQLEIELYFGPGTTATDFRIDRIPHFEILGQPKTDSSFSNGALTRKITYTITSFDSGHWVIPAFTITRTARTDTIGIDVVFSDFDPAREYHDIKDIIEVAAEKKTAWWWYAIGGAVLLALIIIYFLRRKKKPVKPRVVTVANPYEEAIKQLQELERSRPDAKTLHSGLTAIFRLYVFRKKNILSLQKTTDDLVIQLNALHLPKDVSDHLAQALRLGDFVKFAKYIPAETDNRKAMEDIRQAIETIEKQAAAETLTLKAH
jgi:LPXTG-motif cell wall-anchored protein